MSNEKNDEGSRAGDESSDETSDATRKIAGDEGSSKSDETGDEMSDKVSCEPSGESYSALHIKPEIDARENMFGQLCPCLFRMNALMNLQTCLC
jgi:hypothetical protein